MIIAFFVVLITGKWPQGLRNYVVGFMRWSHPGQRLLVFMTDKYPPFRLGE